jgi:hypothetical protein
MRESCATLMEFEESVCTQHVCGDPSGAQHTFDQGDEFLYWGENLSATKTCTEAGWVENEICTDTSGAGSGNGSSGNGGSSNGGNNTNSQDPVVVIPTVSKIISHKSNCNPLNKLSQSDELSADINPLVQELRTKVSEDKEYSVNFKKDISFGEERSFSNPDGIIEGESKTVSTVYWGIQQFGVIHTHPEGTIYMFSWRDVE